MNNVQTKIKSKSEAKVNVGAEASVASILVMGGVASFVGLWSVACLVSAFASEGVVGTVLGWVQAVGM